MIRIRLNIRFLVILVLTVAVLAVGTHFLHAYQVQRNSHALLDQANEAKARGQIAEATKYLARYIGLQPNDTDALAEFGELLADESMATSFRSKFQAMQVLNQVLYRDPNRATVRRLVAKLAIDLGRYQEARADLQDLLGINVSHPPVFPDDGELELLLARCYEKSAKYQPAREMFNNAIQHAPQSLDAYTRLAYLLREHESEIRSDQTKESVADVRRLADDVIEKMVANNSKSHRAYLAQAQYLKTTKLTVDHRPNSEAIQKRYTEAVERAQKLAPDDAEVILAVAELAGDQQKLDVARRELERGCKVHPQNWRLYRGLARLEATAEKLPAAIACLHRGLEHVPGQPDLLWDLADLQIRMNKADEADATIDQLAKAGAPTAYLDVLRARREMATESWPAAARRLDDAFSALVDLDTSRGDPMAAMLATEAGVLLGRCHEQLGDSERAIAAYGRVLARSPRSVLALLGLARNAAALGHYQDAVDRYQQLLGSLESFPSSVLVEWPQALFMRTLERPKDQRDWADVDAAIRQVRQTLPKVDKNARAALVAQIDILESEVAASQGNLEKAREFLGTKYPPSKERPVIVWAALASFAEREGRRQEAIQLLDDAERAHGDQVELRLARARILAAQDTPENRASLARLAEKSESLPRAQRWSLLRGLAAANAAIGNGPECVRLLEQLANERRGDVATRLILFELAAGSSDPNALKTMQDLQGALEKIEKDDGVTWRYARARFLIEQVRRAGSEDLKKKLAIESLPEARTQLAAVAARRPNWPRLAVCQGLLEDVSGRPDQALAHYQQALKLGSSDMVATLRAAELLYYNGRFADANELFKLAPNPQLPSGIQQLAADAAMQTAKPGELAAILARATQVVSPDTKDFRQLIWLGRMYWRANKPSEARAALVRARDLAPTEPDAWVALIQFLANTGQADVAKRELEAAERRLTGPTASLALASCNEAIGRGDRALELYQGLLQARPDDLAVLRAVADFYWRSGRVKQCQEILRKLMAASRDRAPEVFAGARRMLAYLLTFEGGPNNARDALALLGGDTTGKGDTVQDRRARAQILAVQNTSGQRREAVRILEELISQSQAAPEDYFLVAQLHDASGDWPQARQRYLDLVKLRGGDTPIHLASAARSMLRHGDIDTATSLEQMLQKKQANSPLADEIRARVLNATGQATEATTLIKQLADKPGADLVAAAGILTEFKDTDGAEILLRRFVAQSPKPESVLLLIRFLIGQKKMQEAFDLCDRAWDTCSDLAVAEVALQALDAAPAAAREIDRVEARLRRAMSLHPGHAELVVGLATIRNFQGRYDEAVALYRQVLDKNPGNAAALNNLAWLLALGGGHGDEAVALADRATELSGQDLGTRDTRAVALLSLGRSEATNRAIQELEAITTDSQTATAFFHLAHAYQQGQRIRDAENAWKRALALGLSVERLHPLERPIYEQLRQLTK